jgi:ribose transport system substrate-binding protein
MRTPHFHRRRSRVTWTVTLLALCALTGCRRHDRERIAVFTKNQTNPYFRSVRLGADRAAAQLGAQVTHYVPTRPDSIPEQMNEVEDAITKRPDAVVLVPVDGKAMTPAIGQLNAAGVPVVNLIDPADSGSFVAFIGCDEYDIAVSTGRYLLEKMSGAGSVVILEGVGGSVNSANRVRGFKKALEAFPRVKLLASQPANFQRLQALQVMENLLQAHAAIDGVLAANDSMAMGAIEALASANRRALVVSINATKEAVDAIKAGTLLASGDCNGHLQGCMGVMAAIRHVRGLPVPSRWAYPPTIVDRTNYHGADVRDEDRMCPAWETLVQ